MRFLLTPIGSSGDVFPFIAIGRRLRRLGYDVTLVAAEPFQASVAAAGLEFAAAWTAAEYDRVTRDPDLWHPRRGIQFVLSSSAQHLRRAYDVLSALYEPGRTVLVGHGLSFATRLLEEVHAAPAATLQLAPSAFRSEHGMPAAAPGVDPSGLPRWVKRALWRMLDARMLDAPIVPTLNALRADLGLAPVSRIFRSWIHSPRLVLGLFPDWFGRPQPDWPPQLRLTGFPLFDEVESVALPSGLEAFLAAGEPPIVFTPGSANRQAEAFFTAAVTASTAIGRRALLLTRYPEQLPDPLPAGVHYEPFVPLSRLLPRCAAVVHHGGIGTCAQGLAAGVPQLIMPMGFDQPDNVTRLARLGVGTWVKPAAFRARRVAAVLQRLMTDPVTQRACAEYRDRLAAVDGVEQACDALVPLAGG